MKKKILNFILSHFTDYYEIKMENETLRQDIFNLVENKANCKSVFVYSKWKTIFMLKRNVWFGNSDSKVTRFNGIFKTTKSNEN